MTDSPRSDLGQLAEALREAGVEIGSVGGDNFRLVAASRLLASDWLREVRAAAWSEGRLTGLEDMTDTDTLTTRRRNPYRDLRRPT